MIWIFVIFLGSGSSYGIESTWCCHTDTWCSWSKFWFCISILMGSCSDTSDCWWSRWSTSPNYSKDRVEKSKVVGFLGRCNSSPCLYNTHGYKASLSSPQIDMENCWIKLKYSQWSRLTLIVTIQLHVGNIVLILRRYSSPLRVMFMWGMDQEKSVTSKCPITISDFLQGTPILSLRDT